MRFRYTMYVVGAIICSVGLTMLFPLLFSLYYQDAGILPLAESMLITMAAGFALVLIFRTPDPGVMKHREGMAIVAIGWFAAGVVGPCRSGWREHFPTPWTAFSSRFPDSPPPEPRC